MRLLRRSRRKMNKGHGVVLAVIIWAIVGIQPIRAQPLLIESLRPVPTPVPQMLVEQFRDWQVACPNPKASIDNQTVVSCIMEPSPLAYEGGAGALKRLFGRMITVPGKASAVPVFVVETQLDLLLPEGLTLQVDKRRPQKLSFRSCHNDGCLIPFRLSAQLETALRRGITLRLSLITLDGTMEQTNISLLGFTKALKALTEMTIQ